MSEEILKPCPFDEVKTIAEFTHNEISSVKAFLGAARMCGYELVKANTRAPTNEVEDRREALIKIVKTLGLVVNE